MASGVEELLDMLFDMVDEAKNVPLSSDRCMIERDRALDLIDDIRAQFPVELSEAKKVMASRADLIASAKREAEAIRRQAEEKAKQMLSEETILLQAKQRANELMQQAEDRSRELKRSANEYCEDALRRTEEAVAEAYDEIKKSRARFRSAASGGTGGRWLRPTTRSSSPGPGSGRRPAPHRRDRPPPAAAPCTTRRRTRTERISVRHYDRIRLRMRTGTEAPSVPVRLSADGGTGRKTAEISSKNVRIFWSKRMQSGKRTIAFLTKRVYDKSQ